MNAAERELLEKVVELAREVPREALVGWLAVLGDGQQAVAPDEIRRGIVQVGPPAARQAVSDFVTAWRSRAPALPADGIRWALEAAYAADAARREAESVELVWSGPAPPGTTLRRTDQALLDLLRGARRSVALVTFAAYKIPEMVRALREAAERGARVWLILEDRLESGGRLSFSASEVFAGPIGSSVEVYVWPSAHREPDSGGRTGLLHAKCAVADGRELLISSANLTESAMSLNMELGVLLRGGELPRIVDDHLRWLVESGTLARLDSEGHRRQDKARRADME